MCIHLENPRACGCHSLNLVFGNAAISCTEAVSFFSIIHHIYILFSASVGIWRILKDNVTTFTVKLLCNTCQKCWTDCLKSLRYQTAEIHDTLISVNESLSNPALNRSFNAIHQMCDFSFTVTLLLWYNVLHHINTVRKIKQSSTMKINSVYNC